MGFLIENVEIGGSNTVVIAEAGVNHLGRMDYAEELVRTAARAGADIVKFQSYKADKLTVPTAPRFWSWDGEHDAEGSQRDSYSVLDSFGLAEHRELKSLCDKYGVVFLSTPFDNDAVDMLVEVGAKGFKIASCDITNLPFLSYVAKTGLPMLLSTGAATIDEIRAAVDTVEAEGNPNVCVMHCTLCYPTDPKDSNLQAINHIADEFPGYVIGLSDHTLGTIVPAASILYGVKVIEKHYTFDKTLPDSADHWLSLNEAELTTMVDHVRELELAMRTEESGGNKVLLECETPAHKFARRSVVAAIDITEGATITSDMLVMKRPGTGLAPEFHERIAGSVATRDIMADELFAMTDFATA